MSMELPDNQNNNRKNSYLDYSIYDSSYCYSIAKYYDWTINYMYIFLGLIYKFDKVNVSYRIPINIILIRTKFTIQKILSLSKGSEEPISWIFDIKRKYPAF